MKKITIAYFGSPDFSADFLRKLITDASVNQFIDIKVAITQPDAPVGRKQIMTPTPVKMIAEKYKIAYDVSFPPPIGVEGRLQRESRTMDPRSCLRKQVHGDDKNIDLALVYAYGAIIPKKILSLPKFGFWNIHPSLLPKYRGTSPMATPLINGDKTTGVTIIKMDEEIDHGPIITQESLTILDTDYRFDLEKKLTNLGFEMFKNLINKLRITNYELKTTEQKHSEATYTKKLTKQDGFIEFKKLKNLFLHPTSYILHPFYNLFRGLSPWPGIWTILPNGKRLKITGLSLTTNHQPLITKVQLEGKNEVDFETFNKAYKVF